MDTLLMGERVALNLAMRLSGIATLTQEYVDKIRDLPAQLVDTRKTTPGLRILEKYATQVGGAVNHRLGLDDAVMIKDNHIVAAGGIEEAIALIKKTMPYPLTIEVETSTMAEVKEALQAGADIIMLDNMAIEPMQEAVASIRQSNEKIKIEASGNITLDTIRAVAETSVDYISSSAPITRSTWLDISMRMI
jgi:nicotinate-nucleotide pyrophosphorylase (carboxylating)